MSSKKILVTTPDYPPRKIGGISTFVINLEQNLKAIGVDYELFVWENRAQLMDKDFLKYDLVLNAHFMAAFFKKHPNMINFIHGGEILPYSKNIFKNIFKKLYTKKILSSLHSAKYNIFVSEFSFNLYRKLSTSVNYERDLVVHNCIDLKDSKFISKNWNEPLSIICLVRDVAHKNVEGTIKLFKKIRNKHKSGATLYITADVGNVEGVKNISGISESDKEELLRKCHLNLLLSLDHSEIGNVEGFGLTVLEAGKYGVPTLGLATGGLQESIHHKKTGWLFVDNEFISFDEFFSFFSNNYEDLSKAVFKHTTESHGLGNYQRMLEVVL